MNTRQFNIFVEGNDDHDLICALLTRIKDLKPHPSKNSTRRRDSITTYFEVNDTGDTILVLTTGGWTSLGRNQQIQFQQARDSGGRTLIVFDADYDQPQYPQGGQVNRLAALRAQISEFEPDPHIYLFPNPSSDGNLETLLLQIISPNHQCVIDCYVGFGQCLEQYVDVSGSPIYHLPIDKRRVYDYVNALPLSPEERERHQDKGGQKIFENSNWWNFDAPAIQPLISFLVVHLT
ncbi:DUF3226 domain-containing protein [Hymenobacter lucidus]|uniref:DUF4062 domain-containing protein n=1 Tax=Hymenobacter lucidus TaxID=2880930 RepID=A0ABS8AMK7_9BACT|nr:DUF3226 domain-containing protein [Hymenobacter lucidus]MCB2407021.1 hypothetical protein [Hymenobacter lucidus]